MIRPPRPKARLRGRRAIAAAAALQIVVAVAACGAPGSRSAADELRDAARSLAPEGSRVVAERDGDCSEFGAFPSCVTVFFASAPDVPLGERLRRVRERARQQGWEIVAPGRVGPGGSGVSLERPGYDADVALWPSPRQSCAGMSLVDCIDVVDHVQVVRRD